MKAPHPAVQYVLQEREDRAGEGGLDKSHFTSVSLARALAVGCLSRLDPRLTSVDIWDPAAGSGLAGFMLADGLESAGVHVRYRGQDISEAATSTGRQRFGERFDAQVATGDTLLHDAFDDFDADLVIVDPPWGLRWADYASDLEARQGNGSFVFGFPQPFDSTWLFISLALEKLRPAARGGGRVAALVTPAALSAGSATAAVRRRIVEAGLLESVTRLPEALAPNTSIPLYLLTFTNRTSGAPSAKVSIADLQTQFITERRHRSMPVSALRELESGLRTGRPGPRNRSVGVRQFIRSEARLSRVSGAGRRLSWPVTTYNNEAIDDRLLECRYGPTSGASVDDQPRQVYDLNPSRIFGDDSRDLLRDLESKGWPSRRLSCLLSTEPQALTMPLDVALDGRIFVPIRPDAMVSTEPTSIDSGGRILSVEIDDDALEPSFLAAWLNSEQGVSSRRRANEVSSPSSLLRAPGLNPSSLMRWAEELIIPVPDRATQLALASADERLGSFQAELTSRRESVWTSPELADDVVNRIASAFDDSLSAWLDHLPFPIASALWTAETARTPGDQQSAYIHAWEAIVTFHATVLLSATRSDPGNSGEVEAAIRRTLQDNHLGIERASLGTWVVIVERTCKDIRGALESGDADEIARIRRAFGDLGQGGIERLVSKQVVNKFSEINRKRNRWLGHAGHTSEEEKSTRVSSLISDLRELRQILGNVWSQLLLVRAGSGRRGRDGLVQTAELAVGTRSPFITRNFSVGELMLDGELYLVRDGSQSPLRLGQFVQLRAAASSAQYTTYFYNRTEGASVRMVSYQYGPKSELQDDAESFRSEFGALALD